MSESPPIHQADTTLEMVYRSEWGRILAALIRTFGDFDVAEEAAQEAFAAGLDQWRRDGVPEHPSTWLLQTARHKAIDRLRRRSRLNEKLQARIEEGQIPTTCEPPRDVPEIADDRLRLIFTCCHPALARETQVVLTLRTLGGLETDEITHAFLVPTPTMAQRLVRAKQRIKQIGIPYVVPDRDELPERLDAVLSVIYLIFNEGYVASRGAELIRSGLCAEAIRLGRLLIKLLAPEVPPEVWGLLALMLLHDARRPARLDAAGDLVLLEDQDRSLWDQAQIAEALPILQAALGQEAGPYALQAAIAAEHCRAVVAGETDWNRILQLYEQLSMIDPSPVVALNRAVALAFAQGPEPGLEALDRIASEPRMDAYYPLHAARGDLLRRQRKPALAALSFGKAAQLATNASAQRYLNRRYDQMMAEAAETRTVGPEDAHNLTPQIRPG